MAGGVKVEGGDMRASRLKTLLEHTRKRCSKRRKAEFNWKKSQVLQANKERPAALMALRTLSGCKRCHSTPFICLQILIYNFVLFAWPLCVDRVRIESACHRMANQFDGNPFAVIGDGGRRACSMWHAGCTGAPQQVWEWIWITVHYLWRQNILSIFRALCGLCLVWKSWYR